MNLSLLSLDPACSSGKWEHIYPPWIFRVLSSFLNYLEPLGHSPLLSQVVREVA